jgi:hypothetical protein
MAQERKIGNSDKSPTAVEFLEKICKDRGYHLMEEYFEKAKKIEKEQIIKAYDNGLPFEPGEQYYNQTYGKE